VVSNIKETDNAFTWAVAQQPLAEELRDNYPEVKNAVRLDGIGRTLFKNGDKEFYEDKFFLADSTLFDMFTYKVLSGDPNTALDEPFAIVLTRSIAIKYFGTVDAVGQSFQNQAGETFKVTAVMEDVPLNSHLIFDALIAQRSYPQNQGSWGGFGVFTYIQLPEGYERAKIDAALARIIKEKVDPIFEQYGITIKYELQRIPDIHLYSKIQDEAEAGGDISYIYIFSAVAVLMLVIASINYMNLATARSANRSKEVGIRKVMGSQRGQLIAQFIAESVLITFMAMVASLVLIYALLPSFNNLANKQLPFSYILQAPVLLSLVGTVLFIGVIGGSYPAFYLSGFNPVSVLKGKLAAKGGNAVFRKVLVVVQFSISIFMLISTLVVFDQLRFMRNKDLGFTKERVVRLLLSGDEQVRHAGVIAERMRQTRGVEWAGTSNASPGEGIGKRLLKVEDNEGKLSERGVDLYGADYDFIKTLGMHVVQGRDFSRDVASDTLDAVIVNEAMVKRMGWKDPIGKKFLFNPNGEGDFNEETRVVGVVKDYHQNSLYDVIEPLLIRLRLRNRYLFIKTKEGEDVHTALASIESTWKEVSSGLPFEYLFIDQDFNSQYKSDEKRSQIFTVFSGLTLGIACLGLLGLAAFTIEQRYKEIGIRKVIGATLGSLLMLVAREFLVLVGISTLIAFVVAWYITDSWLQKFAYRIHLEGEWLTFIVSALMAALITLVTIGYHVLRAASANPVKALRDE
jgi:putative ABC transport system permease protein